MPKVSIATGGLFVKFLLLIIFFPLSHIAILFSVLSGEVGVTPEIAKVCLNKLALQ